MENSRSNTVAVVATIAASSVLVVSALLVWRFYQDTQRAAAGGKAVSDVLQDCYNKMQELEEDIANLPARI